MLVASAALVLFGSRPILEAVWSTGAGQVPRALVTGLLIAPMGLAMGWFFPSGLKALARHFPGAELVPWAVSINGFASVLGSVVVLPFSMYFGFRALAAVALLGYLVAAGVSALLLRR